MKHFFLVLMGWILLVAGAPGQAQTSDRPLILPMQDAPSPQTWLLGQVYGNTTGAFNFGDRWYSAGQGLHFGLDFSAACGALLVAVADGEVAFVDNLSFGSAPHNLILRHPQIGLTTLYGHLLNTPELTPGQTVQQGDLVGYSGDPDGTCDSRPHLHYEVRSLDYRTAHNPVDYTDADWHSLMLIGSYSHEVFQQDLLNARRWMSISDQPDVRFGGRRLNDYSLAWPPPFDMRQPENPPLTTDAAPLPDTLNPQLITLDDTGCCRDFLWHPLRSDALFAVDGFEGQRAQIYEWSVAAGALAATIGEAPLPYRSADFSHIITLQGNSVQIQQQASGETWQLDTGGAIPSFSADNSRLMWQQQNGENIPGDDEPTRQIYVSDVRGERVVLVADEQGINARWLDNQRLLYTIREDANTAFEVYDTATGERIRLGDWYRPRELRIAPGGHRLAFYLSSQAESEAAGLHLLDTRSGELTRPNWFGAYRWRDATSLFYVPYNPGTESHELRVYDVLSDSSRTLTEASTRFKIMNGRWQVNADASQIAFRNAANNALTVLDLLPGS